MSPLPCSPVSNSTGSESQSFPATSEEESDDSLTTPRPGPSDPAQRTSEKLSRPSVPAFSSSPESVRAAAGSTTAEQSRTASAVEAEPHAGEGEVAAPEGGQQDSDGRRRKPFSYGNYSSSAGAGTESAGSGQQQERLEQRGTLTWSTQSPSPKRNSVYSYAASMPRQTPTVSPHADSRVRVGDEGDIAESSADENTAILRREASIGKGYGGLAFGQEGGQRGKAHDGATEEDDYLRKRKTGIGRSKNDRVTSTSAGGQPQQDEADQRDTSDAWWKRIAEKYGSVELENKGSVARDHLALERTFLAWLRTSLSFASIGIAVTQLFRLNTSLKTTDSGGSTSSQSASDPSATLKQVGKPLGATFLGISILILLLGFHRYFESQHYVIRGRFPASRGSIVLVAFVAGALIVASLAVVLAVAPSAFET